MVPDGPTPDRSHPEVVCPLGLVALIADVPPRCARAPRRPGRTTFPNGCRGSKTYGVTANRPTTSSLPCAAVLCDVDGVLRHWPADTEIEQTHGLPSGSLAAAAFAPARVLPAITGEITDEQWRSNVVADLAETCGSLKRARAAVTAWADRTPVVNLELVALLTRVRDLVPVALVSNGTTRLEQDLARQGLDTLAHTVVNTARVGVVKPDPEIYRIAAARVRTTVERCLFIDDIAENVTVAREVGMTGLHYRHLDDVRTALAPLLRRVAG